MRKLAVLAGAIVTLGIGAAVVSAAIPDADGYTYICVGKNSGLVRARDKGETCRNNEIASRVVATQQAIPNITTYTVRHTFQVPGTPSSLSGIAHFGSSVSCNTGDVAVGGGFAGPGAGIGHASESRPFNVTGNDNAPPTGWAVDFVTQPNQPIFANVYVVCQHTA